MTADGDCYQGPLSRKVATIKIVRRERAKRVQRHPFDPRCVFSPSRQIENREQPPLTLHNLKSSSFTLLFSIISVATTMPSAFITTCIQLAPVVHVMLTIAALISPFSPFLRDLAAHGKIRNSPNTTAGRMHVASSTNDVLFSLIRHPRGTLLNNPYFQISKRRFGDFYSFGLIWAIILGFGIGMGKPHQLAWTLLCIHLGRRWFECRFVHVWKDGTMHIAGYILGMLHYAILPLIFIFTTTIENAPPNDQSDFLVHILGTGFNVYAQYQQYVHHCLLASCRKNRKNNMRSSYSMPNGGWFEYVCCPHYLAEILIYISFAILLHDKTDQKGHKVKAESLLKESIFGLCLCFQSYKHIIMVIWVVTNLSISAKSSYEWYRKQFPKFAKERAALIPFIW